MPKFDEFYVLRLDRSKRARGARFEKITDEVAVSSMDVKCRRLLLPPPTVCALGMELPNGRLYRGRLVMPRIKRALYNKILKEARVAARRERHQAKAAAEEQSAFIKAIIAESNSAIAEGRTMRRLRR